MQYNKVNNESLKNKNHTEVHIVYIYEKQKVEIMNKKKLT